MVQLDCGGQFAPNSGKPQRAPARFYIETDGIPMVGNDKIPARLQPGGDTFLVCPGDGSGEQARETTGVAFFLTSVEKSEAVTNCDHLGRELQDAVSGAKSNRWHSPCCWLPFLTVPESFWN